MERDEGGRDYIVFLRNFGCAKRGPDQFGGLAQTGQTITQRDRRQVTDLQSGILTPGEDHYSCLEMYRQDHSSV
jgi:hypothetical protein